VTRCGRGGRGGFEVEVQESGMVLGDIPARATPRRRFAEESASMYRASSVLRRIETIYI
jgi:hypothetical protein